MPKSLLAKAKEEQDAAEINKHKRRADALDAENKSLRTQLKASYKELETARKFAEFADELADARDPQAWLKEIKTARRIDYAPIACASDWHLGEIVKRSKVNGLNEYNPAIALRRVKKFFAKIPEYVERYTPGTKTLWLWAGGDFASGYIHPELMEENAMSPTQECAWFAELWSDGLAYILRELPGVQIIVPTSFDNHGRTTEKLRVSTAAENSFTQFTYWFLEKRWANEPRVEWRIADGYHNVQRICGRLVRFHYGHAIRFMGGVGGLTIPTRKAISQWNKGQRVDLDVFGHHHNFLDLGSSVTNGSAIGYGSYSLQVKAEPEPPIQAFIVFDKRRGLRQAQRIYVDD